MKLKKKPKFVIRNNEEIAVIIDIKDYREILERLEDVEDLNELEEIRKKPQNYKKLDVFLNEHYRNG